MLKFLERNRLLIIGVLYFGLTIPLAIILNIRQDEAYTLDTTSRGLVYAFNQALHFELQAPLYFVLVSIWRLFFGSIFWARLFSILAIFAALLIFDKILKGRITHRFFPLLFFAIHPLSLWAALEIRVYAFSVLTVAAYLYFLVCHYRLNTEKRRNRLIHIGLILAGLFSFYYFGFILAGVFVYLLLFNRNLLKPYIIDLIIPVLLLMPMMAVIYGQIYGHSVLAIPKPFTIQNLLKYWQVEFFDYFLMPVYLKGPNAIFNISFRLILLAFLSYFLFEKRENLFSFFRSIWFWITLVFIAFLTTLRFSLGSIYAVNPHALLGLIPFLMVLVTLSGSGKNPKLANAMFLILAFVATTSLFSVYKPLYKEYDVKGLVKYLESMPADQPAFVYTNETCMVLNYYLDGDRQLFPLPEKINFENYDLAKWIIQTPSELDEVVQGYLQQSDAGSFFYVADNKVYGSLRTEEHNNLVKDYFSEHFTITDSLGIGGFSVYKISRP